MCIFQGANSWEITDTSTHLIGNIADLHYFA